MPYPNPVSLAVRAWGAAAVFSDGTLWVGGDLFLAGRVPGTEMVRWGDETNWCQVELLGTGLVGIRQDGSLYATSSRGPLSSSWQEASRYRVWTALCAYHSTYLALASDGSVCLWNRTDPFVSHSHFQVGPISFQSRFLDSILAPSRVKARKFAEIRE